MCRICTLSELLYGRETKYFRVVPVSHKSAWDYKKYQANSSNVSRVSEGLQDDQHEEGNDVYGAKEEKLQPALLDKRPHACDGCGLPSAAIDIRGGSIVMSLETLNQI